MATPKRRLAFMYLVVEVVVADAAWELATLARERWDHGSGGGDTLVAIGCGALVPFLLLAALVIPFKALFVLTASPPNDAAPPVSPAP